MKIGTNVSALVANSTLKKTDRKLSDTMEKLSSGYKVNHAKDNPAGIAIAKRMNSQIRGLENGKENAVDGVSVISSADGAVSEIHDILQRMNELAVQAANGTKTDEDRASIDMEIQQLKEEINRISKDTDYNGQPLLDGSFDLRGYTDDANVKVIYYSDEVKIDNYTLTAATYDPATKTASVTLGPEFGAGATVEYDDNLVTIKDVNGFEMKLQLNGNATASPVNMDMTGIGAMRMQIGANEGQVLEIRIPEMSARTMGIRDFNVRTQADALDGIEAVKNAITFVSQARARLGAYQNRLESTQRSLDNTHENVTASYSRIMDVDMAEEMTNYATNQVLVQAGTAMLAQANERPQQVLTLLQ